MFISSLETVKKNESMDRIDKVFFNIPASEGCLKKIQAQEQKPGSFLRYFRAAGITFRLISEGSMTENTLEPKFKFFEVEGPGEDNVVIRHFMTDPPVLEDRLQGDLKLVLDDGIWKIKISDSACVYEYLSEEFAPVPYSVTNIFNRDHSLADVYFGRINAQDYGRLSLPSLTGLGTDQILMSKLLADRNGFLFHSNGVSLENKTVLFTGKSGAGKSTISGMMKNIGGKIFCDDRIIIQKNGLDFTASGSWIHPGVTSDSVFTGKIDAVFFIEQSQDNEITPITKITRKYEKAMKAMVKNFLLSDQWTSTLELMDAFVKRVPFYSLKFNLTNEINNLMAKTIQSL